MNASLEHDTIGPEPRLPAEANDYDRKFYEREMRRWNAQKAARALVDAARGWHEQGFTPMAAARKAPLASGWQTLDAADHLKLIERQAPAQLGLRMGLQRDGRLLIAIDVDGFEGEESIERLAAELGHLPTTLEQRTPRGGRHLVFEWPAALASSCPTTSAGKLGAHIDIRGERGHVVAAPSPGADGGRYELTDPEARPVPLPDAWVQRIVGTHRKAEPESAPEPPRSRDTAPDAVDAFERCRRYVDRMEPAISGSGGHAATWRVAQVAVRGFGLGHGDAMRVLREFNQRCEPPWSARELEHKLDSAEQRSRMPRGWLLDARNAKASWQNDWDADMNASEQDPESARPDPANVKRGPWKGSGTKDPGWRLPEERQTGVIRAPTVRVPEPEDWTPSVTSEQGCPDLPAAEPEGLTDANVNTIATRLLEVIDGTFGVGAFVHDGGRFYIYQDGVFRALPDWWVIKAAKLYHGMGEGKHPFCANVTNLRSIQSLIEIDLRARQLASDERSFFDDSPALAVFGSKTLLWNARKRAISLEQNSPEHRAVFSYPFEFAEDECEPKHLLSVLRGDTFAGVEPEEIERRILRIRQQFGLAMLGAQKLAKLHSVLIMIGQGHDGKSTLLALLQACMPPGSWNTMQPLDLSSGTGDGAEGRADLHNLFAVMCEDVSERAMGDSSHYKTATAYGPVRGRHFGSGVKSFRVNVRATWLLATQQLWHTTDKTRGFQRRHCIVEFTNSIPDGGAADRELLEKILAHEQRELILWCVRAAIDLLKGGTLAQPECSARLMRAWMLGGDDVASFLEANTVDCSSAPKESWPRTEDLHREYCDWVKWTAGSGRANPVNLVHFGRKARQVAGIRVETHNRISRISRRVDKGDW